MNGVPMPMSAPMGFLTATSNGTALCSAHEYCCIVTRYSLAAGAVHVSVFKSAVLLLVLVSTIYLLGPSTRRSPHHPSARVRRTVAVTTREATTLDKAAVLEGESSKCPIRFDP